MAKPAQKTSTAIVIGINQLERVARNFSDASRALASEKLMDAVGEQQAASAKRRIGETKKTPAGKKWKAWSQPYAATRGPQHSLLVDTGSLRDSITHVVVNAGEVQVGSNLVYAAVHLYGEPGEMPQRAFLDTEGGFADPHDRAEIREILSILFKGEVYK